MDEPLPDSASRLGRGRGRWRHTSVLAPTHLLTAQTRRKSSVFFVFEDAPTFRSPADALSSRQRKSWRPTTTPRQQRDALSDFLSKQANVQWASSLPAKAQQVYFSHAEQISIAAAACASPRSRHPSLVQFDLIQTPTSSAGESSQSTTSASTPPAMERTPSQPLYHWQAQKAFLDDYHQRVATASVNSPVMDKVQGNRTRSRRPSFKRTISLISETRARSSADLTSPPASVANPSRKSWSNVRRPLALARSSTDTVLMQAPQSPLQYYQDPTTRKKLKEYLGSPKGFEEALEHGFPSEIVLPVEDAQSLRPRTSTAIPRASMTSHRGATNDASKFLRNEVLSWLENSDEDEEGDDDSVDREDNMNRMDHFSPDLIISNETFDINDYLEHDDVSSPELTSPVTPHTVDFMPMGRRKSARYTPHPLPAAWLPASPRSPPLPHQSEWPLSNRVHDHPDAYSTPTSPSTPAWPGAREMTIRMTLTRPELRAPEKQINGHAASGPGPTSARYMRKPVTSGDPMDLPSLNELTLEEQEQQRASVSGHARRKSLWRKMSIGGLKK